MSRDRIRWWYALVPFPALVGLRYLLVGLTALLLPGAGPTRAAALPVLSLALAASLVGALAIVAAPVFAAGALLDVWALRNRSPWTPTWGYAALGALPSLGLLDGWLALLSVPAAALYLERRRRQVGSPGWAGIPRWTDEPTSAERRAAATAAPWWLAVAVPPAIEVIARIALWLARTTGALRHGGEPIALLVPAGLSLAGAVLVPVFAVGLFLDARAIARRSPDGAPDPRLWGLLGLAAIVGLAALRVTLMLPIALAYAYRRRTVGTS